MSWSWKFPAGLREWPFSKSSVETRWVVALGSVESIMRTISFSTFDMFQNHGLFLHLYRFGYFNRRISLSAKFVREIIFYRSCSRFYSASGPISCLRGSSPAGWVRVLGFRLGDGLG